MTIKDVKINPELSEEQQAEVRTLPEQYTDIFTDVPSFTNVSEHVIQLQSQLKEEPTPYHTRYGKP